MELQHAGAPLHLENKVGYMNRKVDERMGGAFSVQQQVILTSCGLLQQTGLLTGVLQTCVALLLLPFVLLQTCVALQACCCSHALCCRLSMHCRRAVACVQPQYSWRVLSHLQQIELLSVWLAAEFFTLQACCLLYCRV